MQRIEYISVDFLNPHPDNPRKDLGDLKELSASIKAKGVLQNLTVVPYFSKVHQRTMEGMYTVIIGHRRLEAAKRAGLTEVPCIVENMTMAEQIDTMMVENVHRSDLTAYEQAEGFQLMLTMGGTVKEVAEKTGFSETTIRRRVKLLELDAGKFKKAESQGGTLQDLLRLNEIKNVDLRNKVLDTIGTPSFNNTLKSAIDEEKFDDEFAQTEKEIRAADWCRERTDEEISWNGSYVHYRHYYRYNRDPITPPADTDVAVYIFVIRDKDISIYRKGPQSEKAKTPEDKKRAKYAKEMSKINEMVKSITATHRELRVEFVREAGIGAWTKQDGIHRFAAKTALFGPNSSVGRQKTLGELIESPIEFKNGFYYLKDKTKWDQLLRNNPLKALFFATYSYLEGNVQYFFTEWVSKLPYQAPKYKKDPALDLIYEGLEAIGYEMSEEEIQMQKGTHPLFREAAELIKAYKKEGLDK